MNSAPKTLLIIDDDRFFCDNIARYLEGQDFEIITAHSKEEATAVCKKSHVDVVLLDQNLPDGSGIDLCTIIVEACEQSKIIFITAYPSFENAVKALRNGAYDYLSKPLEIEELAMTVDQAFRTLALENLEQVQKYKNRQEYDNNVLIGKNGGLQETAELIKLSATNDVPVLITGETGTGKSVVAKAIHYLKGVTGGPFIGINCAALPENLIESELFGHEKGAFTGAVSAKKGIFELADGGTLFLDEIGDLPLHLQSKLLGVLDDKMVKRLGGQSLQRVSARIIAATNINLEEAVKNNTFRQDLYYRLSVMRIHVPPLRQRSCDIGMLCRHFIQASALQDIHLPEAEIEKLTNYSWPGNVRELKNVIERAIILKKNNTITPSQLLVHTPGLLSASPRTDSTTTLPTLKEIEEQHIKTTLKQLYNNHTRAAESLGISRSTLLRKLSAMKNGPGVAL